MTFSKHAADRLLERTKLTCFEVQRIIDRNLAVNLGSKPGINKHHWLIYSRVDDAYYVAIQDSLDGTFITVLPLDYHTQLAWVIREAQKNQALVLVAAFELKTKLSGQVDETKKVITVRVIYDTTVGLQRSKVISRLLSIDFNHDITVASNHVRNNLDVYKLAIANGINPSAIVGVSIGNSRNKGTVAMIELHELVNWRLYI